MGSRRYNAHPQSAEGDFYVVNNECVACGAPHVLAPELIGWAEHVDYVHCIWKRQPSTTDEIEAAIGAVLASEVACHRYAGDDQRIIDRLGPDLRDAPLPLRPAAYPPSRNMPAPPMFALLSTGSPILERLMATLASMVSRLIHRR